MRHTIFLSYSSAQGGIAACIELALEEDGHTQASATARCAGALASYRLLPAGSVGGREAAVKRLSQ